MSQGVKYGYGKGSSGQYNSAGIVLVDGEQSELQLDAAGRLITNATVTATFVGPQEVIISDLDDSIKIGNGSGVYMAVNLDGSINTTSVVSGTVDTNLKGLNAFQTSSYTVGTAAVQITPTPLVNRSSLIIKVKTVTNADIVWIGNSAGVTVGGGYPLYDGDTLQLDLTSMNSIYAISNAAGQKVYALEMGA